MVRCLAPLLIVGAAAAPHTWKPTSSCDYDAAAPAYVSDATGADADGSGASPSSPYKTIAYAVTKRVPCQTIHVMPGTYKNTGTGAVVPLAGVEDLVITNYDADDSARPVIEFTGSGGFVGGSPSKPVKNVEISGFEIVGPGAKINYTEALAKRIGGSNYYKGRGIAVWAGDHLYFHDNMVHHCPSSGIRVNKGDYVTISNNVVYSNTWWSSAAESAVVLATSKDIDTKTNIKMRLEGNVVFDNMNKIPYYNKNYAWDYSPIGGLDCSSYSACKDGLVDGCPWQCRYGKATQDYIIDGMGVYVTRNKDTYTSGKMQMSDNVCYGNGINGLVVHRTDRVQVKKNVIYDNGVVPRGDKPEPVAMDWHASVGKGRQPYSGLVLNNADGVTLWSNKVAARYADDFAYTQEVDGSGPPTPVDAGGNNKACVGRVQIDPASIVKTSSDSSVCGVKYTEVACGAKCHLISWPYKMYQSYLASEAKLECEAACDDAAAKFAESGASEGGCQAFSLQQDYRPGGTGKRYCFLYKEAPAPDKAKCQSDPFNTDGCSYATTEGQFFITPAAMAKNSVKDLASSA